MKGFLLLRNHKDYRHFWISNFISYIGIWIQVGGCGILMSQHSHSAIMIALVQVLSSLPVFLFAIPFGVIADFCNIYALLAITQLLLSFSSFVFSFLAFYNFYPSISILIYTAIVGIAAAIRLPSGQSAISTSIPDKNIKIAAIMNNLGFSIARAIGPIIAGVGLFYTTPSIIFFVVGLLFLLASYFFLKKMYQSKIKNKSKVNFLSELWRGFNYLSHDAYLRFICISSFIFFFFSTSIWSALPYIAQYVFFVNVKTQGAMMGAIGIGSILTGFILPCMRTLFSERRMLFSIFLLAGLSISGWMMPEIFSFLSFVFLLIFGFSWAAAVAYFNGEMQSQTPPELRSRLISIYFFIMYGGISLGNMLTGKLLSVLPAKTLFFSAGGSLILIGLLLNRKKW